MPPPITVMTIPAGTQLLRCTDVFPHGHSFKREVRRALPRLLLGLDGAYGRGRETAGPWAADSGKRGRGS